VPNPGEPDSYDIDLCQGFSFQPNTLIPTHNPKSLAKLLGDCIWKSLKGRAIEEVLKAEVSDETERKILAALLNEVSDLKAEARFTVTVNAKCDGPRLVATAEYAITAEAGGLGMTKAVKSLGPFRCRALDQDWCSCKYNPWRYNQ
jgi:hypothetical protein